VLVNPGFVPAPDGVRPQAGIDYREIGPKRLHGIAFPIPDQGDGSPVTFRGLESWGRLELSALRARFPYPIRSYVIVAAPDSSSPDHTLQGRSYPIRIEPPPLDSGPHLAYAIQWFLIGGLVLGFAVVFVLGSSKGQSGA